MLDNTSNRLLDVFFYGLYMDSGILREKGVASRNPRKAVVVDYELRIGQKATLLRAPGKTAHGMVYAMTHGELHSLYWGAGLDEYCAEALLARTTTQENIPVLCCNLLHPPAAQESNPDYAASLTQVMKNLGLPEPAFAG